MTRRSSVADILMVVLLSGTAQCTPAREKPSKTPPARNLPQPPLDRLSGTAWQLVKFEGGDGLTLRPDDKSKYTLAFGTDGRVSARIDCNRGGGTWKSSAPSQLEFGPLALTRAMCPPGSLHDRMVKHWSYVRSYVIQGGHLFVSLMADGGIYEFEPATQEQSATPASLENTYWKLTHLGESPVMVPYRDPQPHLILDSRTRRAGGLGVCNRFSGSYELNGDRLRLGPLAATLMACAAGTVDERVVFSTLGRVRRWQITGKKLELRDGAGNVVARFEEG